MIPIFFKVLNAKISITQEKNKDDDNQHISKGRGPRGRGVQIFRIATPFYRTRRKGEHLFPCKAPPSWLRTCQGDTHTQGCRLPHNGLWGKGEVSPLEIWGDFPLPGTLGGKRVLWFWILRKDSKTFSIIPPHGKYLKPPPDYVMPRLGRGYLGGI